jgi:hypothetical protein
MDKLSRGRTMQLWSCFKRERYDITALMPALSPKLRRNNGKSIAKLQPHKVPLPVHHGRHGQDEHTPVAASLCGGGGKYGKDYPIHALAFQYKDLAQSSRVLSKRSPATPCREVMKLTMNHRAVLWRVLTMPMSVSEKTCILVYETPTNIHSS